MKLKGKFFKMTLTDKLLISPIGLIQNECSTLASLKNLVISTSKLKKSFLPEPSPEQSQVLSAFKAGYNLRVEAVAGAGKTTTLLMCAEQAAQDGKTLILLTFNRALKDDICQKIEALNLSNYLKAYTYHGIATKIYGDLIINDIKFLNALDNIPEDCPTGLNSDILLIDEAQDMSEGIYRFLIRHLNRIRRRQVIIVGDRRQAIYEFRGADYKYLTECETKFKTGRPWKYLNLKTSYRLTPSIANFINIHVLNQKVLIGGNKIEGAGLLPEYNIGVWDISDVVNEELKYFDINEVAVIAPSVQSARNYKSPLGQLTNSSHNILFHVVHNDRDENDQSISQNKLLISTFHAMKGREKDCIILTRFDESYFQFFDRTWDNQDSLPNILYVAATRARKKLIILQDGGSNPLRSIKRERLSEDTLCPKLPRKVEVQEIGQKMVYFVTDILKHRDVKDIVDMMKCLEIQEIATCEALKEPKTVINFKNNSKDYYEEVSAYYGIAIPMLAEIMMYGTCRGIESHPLSVVLSKFLAEGEVNFNPTDLIITENGYYSTAYRDRPYRRELDRELLNCLYHFRGKKTPRELMKIVILMESRKDQNYLRRQISNYNWVNDGFMLKAASLILKAIPKGGLFEYECFTKFGQNDKVLKGKADYFEKESQSLWELKCCSSDSREEEHLLQLAAYLSMSDCEKGSLYNVKTGKITTIQVPNKAKFLEILTK